MTEQLTHFIDGARTQDTGGRSGAVFNPATGQQTATLAFADDATLERAVAAAKQAFPDWSAKTPLTRARVLFKFKELVEANRDKLAEMICREHGKVFNDAQGEVTRGIEVIEFATGAPHLLKGDYTPQVGGQRRQLLHAHAAWASWPGSRRSTSRRWCRCGCSRWRSPAATPSS